MSRRRKPFSDAERSIKASWAAARHVSFGHGAAYERAETADIIRAAGALPAFNGGRPMSNYEHHDPILTPFFAGVFASAFSVSAPTATFLGGIASNIVIAATSFGPSLQLAPRP